MSQTKCNVTSHTQRDGSLGITYSTSGTEATRKSRNGDTEGIAECGTSNDASSIGRNGQGGSAGSNGVTLEKIGT